MVVVTSSVPTSRWGLGGCHNILFPVALGPGSQSVCEIIFKVLAFYSNCVTEGAEERRVECLFEATEKAIILKW